MISGVASRRAFRHFRFQNCLTAEMAREVFDKQGVPQYWDMCRNWKAAMDTI
jgi:hypothetical protein